MPKLAKTTILPYRAEMIHQLVMDIEKYPEFLPWCKQAKIVNHISDKILHADLLVNFKNFFEKYRSEVTHGKNHESVYFVESRAIEGPFKSLFSEWKIKDLGENSCQIDFYIEFEFNSFILGKMLGGIFERASEKMMSSFEERAHQLYKS